MEIPVNNPGSLPKRTQREHRQHSRTKVIVTVELQPDGTSAPLRVETTDLSIGGLYVEMMFTLEAGTKLKIVLWISDLKMSTGGVVVTRAQWNRVYRHGSQRPGEAQSLSDS